MTVCMGAICSDEASKQAVVVASDRMVTMANLIEFEHGIPKLTQAPPRAAVMAAGDALAGSALIDGVVRAGSPPSVADLAKALAQSYLQIRQAGAETQVLAPRGLTWAAFYGQHAQMQPQIVMMIDQALAQYNLGLELLVAGVDDTGGHLYSVHNPGGTELRHDVIGFAAIGSGSLPAMQSMIGFAHTATAELKETVFRVYASKRRAETAPGVGNDTDVWIVRASGVRVLDQDVIEELAELYKEFLASVAKNVGSRISKLDVAEEPRAGVPARPEFETERETHGSAEKRNT
jgi:20S proteasome alpha/beta subunit